MPGARFLPDATLNFAENLLRLDGPTDAIVFRDEAGARRMCVAYRARGGHCFVRAGAGDQAAVWTKK